MQHHRQQQLNKEEEEEEEEETGAAAKAVPKYIATSPPPPLSSPPPPLSSPPLPSSSYTDALQHPAAAEKSSSSLPTATSSHASLLTRMESVEGGVGEGGRDEVVVVRTRAGR